MKKVYIIAEAGVNHNGQLTLAKKMVRAAKEAGADCIKFQTFISDKIASKNAKKADYQKQQTGENETQLAMLKKLELSFDEYIEIKNYCNQIGIAFLSTPFDLESIRFLDDIDMQLWKIPSGEITDLPYLIEIAKTHKPIIMSTGMSNMDEIAAAIDILREYSSGGISLLHCTTEYPTPYKDVNLKAIRTLKEKFKFPVGYSDHTKGIEVAIAAVAMGATILEKHFTLDRNMEGPDHKASIEPAELSAMVNAIRNIELAMGDGEKKPSQSEIKNIAVARKSITASRSIKKGEVFTENNITVKRPGNGINPMRWFEILGQKAIKDFKEDEMIVI